MIYVLYATKVNIGGWATFTRHLVDVLRLHGESVELVKFGNRTEQFYRPFGSQHEYRNMTCEDLAHEMYAGDKCIIAALGKHYVEEAEQLIALGAKVVVHDTAESTNRMEVGRPWVIRKALLEHFPNGVFIRHPYVRHTPEQTPKRRVGAVATSRVDFDKNTAMILDANRLGANIDIVGFENRLYTRFKIMPYYPEWQQSPGTHPRTGVESFHRLTRAKFMVDLTDIKGDGGGTQYTFLEAWDAGATPIIGSWWLRSKDDMKDGVNCYAVADAADLARTVKKCPALAIDGSKLLRPHSAKVLGPQIMEWLNA